MGRVIEHKDTRPRTRTQEKVTQKKVTHADTMMTSQHAEAEVAHEPRSSWLNKDLGKFPGMAAIPPVPATRLSVLT